MRCYYCANNYMYYYSFQYTRVGVSGQSGVHALSRAMWAFNGGIGPVPVPNQTDMVTIALESPGTTEFVWKRHVQVRGLCILHSCPLGEELLLLGLVVHCIVCIDLSP